MRVLLLGERGYLGSYLNYTFNFDILEKRQIYNNGKQYNYVINCIGKPDLEYCELNREETDYSNRDIIKDITKYYPNSKIINFSSYYIYNDYPVCVEESKTISKYNYTRQKLEGEQLIANGVTFRIGKLFGHFNNTQNKLTDYILNNDNLFLDNVYFNPTSLKQISKVIEWELENNKLEGIFNLANNDITTHYEYGIFINNYLKTNKNITLINKIQRSFDNYGNFLMSCDKIKQYISLSPWEEDMINYLEKWKHK